MTPERFEAWLSEDRQTVHLRRGGWAGDFPISELPRWMAFYRDMRDRRDRKYAPSYGPTVRALKRIEISFGNSSATKCP